MISLTDFNSNLTSCNLLCNLKQMTHLFSHLHCCASLNHAGCHCCYLFWLPSFRMTFQQTFLFSKVYPASYSMGTRHSLLGVNWQRWEADCSSPSSAQVKNEWGYVSTPPICLQEMYSDNFGFLLYFTYLPMTLHKTYNIDLFT
jgi:hypothetical protein